MDEKAGRSHWTLEDRIDLEWLLAWEEAAADESPSKLADRDRALYLSWLSDDDGDGKGEDSVSRFDAIGRWLDVRSEERFPEGPTPADHLMGGVRRYRRTLTLFGFLAMLGVGLLYLLYVWAFSLQAKETGEHLRIDLIPLFAAFCLLPFLSVLFEYVKLLGRLILRPSRENSRRPVSGRSPRAFNKLVDRLVEAQAADQTDKRRDSLADRLKARLSPVRGVMEPSWFQLRQSAGLAASLGAVVVCLLLLPFSSHLRWGMIDYSEEHARLVHMGSCLAASPWNWFIPEGQGEPTLPQVRATWIGEDGPPEPGAGRAWAQFLLLSTTTYFFLPQLILFAIAAIGLRQAATRDYFKAARFDRLWNRMRQPRVDMVIPHAAYEEAEVPGHAAPALATSIPGSVAFLLLPQELDREELTKPLMQWIHENKLTAFGMDPIVFRLRGEAPTSPVLRGRLQAAIEAALEGEDRASQRVMLVEEARMPPTQETRQLLFHVREYVGPDAGIDVLLLGDYSPEAPLGQEVDDMARVIWIEKLSQLEDPQLRVFPVV